MGEKIKNQSASWRTKIKNKFPSLFTFHFSPFTSEKGQVLLIVVLVMLVSLTVGMAVVSRSITTLRNSNEEANSERAFSAAEAGIERVLKTGAYIADAPFGENSRITATVSGIVSQDGTTFLVNGGNPVSKDDAIDVWLVEHNSTDGTLDFDNSGSWTSIIGNKKLTVYWGNPELDSCSDAALEIIAITRGKDSPYTIESKRYAIDPCSTRRISNNFESDDNTPPAGLDPIENKTFEYKYTIDLSNTKRGVLVRVIPFYANSPIGIKGCNDSNGDCTDLPSQGKKIESVGSAGSTQRKVVYYQSFPKLPTEFFQYIKFVP